MDERCTIVSGSTCSANRAITTLCHYSIYCSSCACDVYRLLCGKHSVKYNAQCSQAADASAHCIVPISTRREHARAKAKISSSPVNIELELTTPVERPYTNFNHNHTRVNWNGLQGHPLYFAFHPLPHFLTSRRRKLHTRALLTG